MKRKRKFSLVSLKVIKSSAINRLLLLSGALVFALILFAQKPANRRKELEAKRKELQARIELTKKAMEETRKRENAKQNELKIISAQINTREKIINNLEQQIFELSIEIEQSRSAIDTLKARVANLKADFARNVRAIYKHKSTIQDMVFLFNSENFNQALNRIKYLQKFSEYRQLQTRFIKNTQGKIEKEIERLIAIRLERMKVAGVKEDEKQELETDKQEQNMVLTELKSKEKQLQAELSESEKAYRKLNKAIEDLITKEIEEARKKEEARRRALEDRAEKAAKSKFKKDKPAGEKDFLSTLSPQALKLSNDFVMNRGRLPWPVDNGYVSESFGEHAHPTLKAVRTKNNGINIACKRLSLARSVFKGTVKAVFSVPGLEYIVLVNHGEYYTVYANLENVTVRLGQDVGTGHELGTVYTNEDEHKTELHFELFKQKQMQNPELWLRE